MRKQQQPVYINKQSTLPDILQLQSDLRETQQQLAAAKKELQFLHSLKFYKVWQSYVRVREGVVPHRALYYLNQYKNTRAYKKTIEEIVAQHPHRKGIIIYPPSIDWHIPLYQRPQHIVSQLAALGYLCFYGTSNTYDNVHGFEKLQKNLYLTDQFSAVLAALPGGWIVVHAGHPAIPLQAISKWQTKGFQIIYEYMDEINEDIAVDAPATLQRHKAVTDRHLAKVIVTAQKLYTEMQQKVPAEKILLNPNGVDMQHFSVPRSLQQCPGDLLPIVEQKKPIIGYYGALAKWIDYECINTAAAMRPDWNFVLIGWDFEGSMKRLKPLPNIYYLGIKPYEILPQYAVWFDVAMIPFKNGKIAQGTSPIKLFEYFALQKCVVVTKDLLECLPYAGVFVARSKAEFTVQLATALAAKDDKKLQQKLHDQAKQNTWKSRALAIDRFLTTESN